MPIYEYKCKICGQKFEVLVYSDGEKIICDKCGSEDSERLMSGFAATSSSSSLSNSCGGSGAFT
jgi:putative FmdB family regulatory protein